MRIPPVTCGSPPWSLLLFPWMQFCYTVDQPSITRTRITKIPHWLAPNFLSLGQNFTEVYPENSNSPLTWTVFCFPSEFELLGLYSKFINNVVLSSRRGAEWYLEKRGSRKILAGSRNLGSIFDKSRSLVFSWFIFTFLSLKNFHQRVSGLDF